MDLLDVGKFARLSHSHLMFVNFDAFKILNSEWWLFKIKHMREHMTQPPGFMDLLDVENVR